MVSFSSLDIIILCLFFLTVLLVGFLSGRGSKDNAEEYLLSGRNLGLLLFVLTNVSTWYGGILGVGEFSYSYGILSWVTQGLPYYIFAIIFAFFFSKKIRSASLFTVPDKLEEVYGRKTSLVSAIIIFVLVSPASYILMTANLLSLIFNINIFYSLLISIALSIAYLFKGGFKSDVYTDVFEFFIMFIGFIVIVATAYFTLGGAEFLKNNLPDTHLTFTGGASPVYILVWFLIALWTFVDPGFHQRCYAAKSGSVAFKGIIVSIALWGVFDFLTTSTGLYARALIPDLNTPVLAYPLLAEKILGPGLKGIFYAGLFATILSTQNSFMFLSASTFSRDFIFRLSVKKDESRLKLFTIYGLVLTGSLSMLLASIFPSVIEIWYVIGSICIPGIILPVIGAYYPTLRTESTIVIIEIITAFAASLLWYIIRDNFQNIFILNEIEPMITGLIAATIIHITGLILKKVKSNIIV